ncbi:MAG: 4Fe-4S dicluster domain-containing protein [Clostridia bacterium]|nr:4Fe-4S dicluster domain-containing protein [Clostridia bacterium]
MNRYEHSVCLDVSKCNGCTTCLKHCPTEAIRIRDKHAVINADRCIDCGQCIRVCPNQAKKANYKKLEAMDRFRWKIALPAPSLYGQFENLGDVDYVLQGLLDIGFDDVFEVSAAAELVSAYTRRYIRREGVKRPIISSACPAVVRLIALRFPSLYDNIMPILPPMEVAAMLARERARKAHPELRDEDIGVCFISPCPAKVSYVAQGFGSYKSQVDCVVAMKDVYFALINVMSSDKIPTPVSHSGMIGISWATSGGESSAVFNDSYLAADGIRNVIDVLDEIETGKLPHLEFIELNACEGGCVGGVLAVENPYIARTRLQSLRRYLPVSQNFLEEDEENRVPDELVFDDKPVCRPITRLADSMVESMRRMSEINRLSGELPGLDCGSCGAPTCRAFAEDLVRGEAAPDDCVVRLCEQLKAECAELRRRRIGPVRKEKEE